MSTHLQQHTKEPCVLPHSSLHPVSFAADHSAHISSTAKLLTKNDIATCAKRPASLASSVYNCKRTCIGAVDTNRLSPAFDAEIGIKSCGNDPPSVTGTKAAENQATMEGSKPSSQAPAADSAMMNGVDANLYSRQIGAFGLETMNRLVKMNVLISGLRGVGVETAKNIILAGPASVTLHDDNPVELRDLASNFYATEEDVRNGKTRAEACYAMLASLNDYVSVNIHTGPIDDILREHNVAVFSSTDRTSLVRYNKICRSANPSIGFIFAEAYGLAAAIFVDFGPSFTINNSDGEDTYTSIVAGITHEAAGTVHVHNEKRMPFQDGDYVTFKEVVGMTELNGCEPRQIKVTGKHSFTIGDTSSFTPYERGGLVQQVKLPKAIEFASFEERCTKPVKDNGSLPMPDLGKFGRSEQLHFAIQALLEYQCRQGGKLPQPRHQTAVDQCIKIAESLNDSARQNSLPVVVDQIDAEVVKNVVQFGTVNISPVASFVGGVAAQEIVKFTGKFTPICQWLHFDCFELLPKEDTKDYLTPTQNRYSDQIVIWGAAFQKRLAELKVFLVGAGALGCELLKEFALMGFCVGNGKLIVADNDSIETSNLNRQFLFRRQHVGLEKSTVAAASAREMNPDVQITTLNTRVGVETEDTYDDQFWHGLDVVVNALDNVPSRLYIDSRCVWYGVPLLESGTLGTKANVQVVVPNLTESYGDSQDPPEESFPLCTLKHFPHEIEHTIQWSRDAFQGMFADGPQQTISFLKNPEEYLHRMENDAQTSQQREKLERIRQFISLRQCSDEDSMRSKCVSAALALFHDFFYIQISQLLYNFPLDHTTANGLPFWSGPKRPPRVIQFDASDPMHLNFVKSAANILAYTVRIKPCDSQKVREVAAKTVLQPFVPRQVRIKVNETDTTAEGASDDDAAVASLKKELQNKCVASSADFQVAEFEKDDDTNFHVDFIWTCANLRARNYGIEECDRHKAKMISGRIIPAIATTTSMVTGLVALEVLKVIDYKKRPIEDYKNAFVNLSLPIWLFSEPMRPSRTMDKDYDPIACGPVRVWPCDGFTTWDHIEIVKKNGTVEDMLKEVERMADCDVAIVSIGNCCLYNSFLPGHKSRLKEPVKELYERISRTKLPDGRGYVACEFSCCSKKDGVDIVIPVVKYTFA